MTTLLTVCLGNICRSPTAEAALRAAAERAGLEVTVRSAGTGSWHVGRPPDARMREAAEARGLRLEGVAEQVTSEAVDAADLVLAMDRSNLAVVRRLADEAGATTPIHLFRSFDPAADGDPEVPDPYYGGPDGFDEVVDICLRTATAVVERLRRERTGADVGPGPLHR